MMQRRKDTDDFISLGLMLLSHNLRLGMAKQCCQFGGQHWLFHVEQPHPGSNVEHIKTAANEIG